MKPSQLPGYVQGFRFSDEKSFWDADGQRFLDQSPYARWANNHCEVIAGTPTFETVSGYRGLRIDNACHLQFLPGTPWQGTILLVANIDYSTGGTIEHNLILWNDFATASNGARLLIRHGSGDRSLRLSTPGGVLALTASRGSSNGPIVAMFSLSQETRRMYALTTGDIALAGPDAGTTNGQGVSFGGAGSSLSEAFYARLGVLLNDGSNLTPQTGLFGHIFEMHSYSGPSLLSHPDEATQVVAALRNQYGLA